MVSELPYASVLKRVLVRSLSYMNKTNFYMKGFALGLALKQGVKGKSEVEYYK